VPADNPLGRRSTEAVGRRLRVAAVLPARGFGLFALAPSIATEPLAAVSLADAQRMLREGDVANAILVVTAAAEGAADDGPGGRTDVADIVRGSLRPHLTDLGLALEAAGDASARLVSRRLVLPPEADRAAAEVLGPLGGRPSLAFLATSIAPLDATGATAAARVPYSTVLGIDATELSGGGLVDRSGRPLPVPRGDEIVIDRWLADDLAAQGRPVDVGDRLAVESFEPETLHGRVADRSDVFRIVGIAEMQGLAVDRSLVPEVEGVTDEGSIADWDPPFPFDAGRVRTVPPHDEDDRYWKEHGATPKAFVALETARRIAAGRFGRSTAWHVAAAADRRAELAGRLAAAIDPQAAGMRILPLRADALAASRGSTPFGGLFLALSAFVVAAGATLAWLLFALLVAAQRKAIGTLAALGFTPRRLAAVLLCVGGGAALAGVLVGLLLGPLWTTLLLAWLRRAWDRDVVSGAAAVFDPGLGGAASGWLPAWESLAAGLGTLAVAVLGLGLAARAAGRRDPLQLLRGVPSAAGTAGSARRGVFVALAVAAFAAAAATAVFAGRAPAAQAVGSFFAAGGLALAGALTLVRAALLPGRRRPLRSLAGLAGRMLAARPGRSFSVAAIVACGQFLVVAVSAFAVRPPVDPDDPRSPTGGWSTLVSFGEPTAIDPSDAGVRLGLGLSAAEERAAAGSTIALLRSNAGDDASCSNLYAVNRPAVTGVGPAFIGRGGFTFVAHLPLEADDLGNPWRLLDRGGGDEPVPAILDQATAQWGLGLGGLGDRFTLTDESAAPVECRIVGLLEPGILQGRVLVAESSFQRLFPARSGYSAALVDGSRLAAGDRAALDGALRTAWADVGVAIEPAVERLRSLQAVQNTFLTGFQALGTLGLLLGAAGVAAVQLQGVAERRGGLAVLRALGFTPTRMRRMLVLEAGAAVAAGVAAGTLAGAVAVWPAVAGGSARLPAAWIACSGLLVLLAAVAATGWATTRAAIPERPREA